MPNNITQTINQRVDCVLKGQSVDLPPFIDRLELWYTHHRLANTMPEEFTGMSLTDVHRAVGMGQQEFLSPYSLRLRGVEVQASLDGEIYYREVDPVLDTFPRVSELLPRDRAGSIFVEFVTSRGRLSLRYRLLEQTIADGAHPYPTEHLLKDASDVHTLEHIIEHADYVRQYDRVSQEQARLGDIGFVVPMLTRIPFQQVLLDYLGEEPLFYALHDDRPFVTRLLDLLDQQMIEVLYQLADLDVLYVQFPDNLESSMTNRRLFTEFCLPAYQRYSDILHSQGKKVGSHTDGNIQPLLGLLSQSGLDVCESFSPAPLTQCSFEETWDAWQDGPTIWGGIPSPVLEERTNEREFRNYIERLLRIIGDRPMILGVGDMVMGNNLIERVRYVANRIEGHANDE